MFILYGGPVSPPRRREGPPPLCMVHIIGDPLIKCVNIYLILNCGAALIM